MRGQFLPGMESRVGHAPHGQGSPGGRPDPKPGSGEEFAHAAARLAVIAGALLGWRPAEFWAATPAELGGIVAAMLPREAAAAPPDGDTLRRLMEAFPDG